MSRRKALQKLGWAAAVGLPLVTSIIAPRAVEAIQQAAKTDKIGDGKIFVFSVEEALRIRTGERGRDAV